MKASECKYCKITKQLIQQAHREGWEQAKEKCVKISMGMFDCNGEEVANAIAAMEYGGESKCHITLENG